MTVLTKNKWKLKDNVPEERVARLAADMPKVDRNILRLLIQRGLYTVDDARFFFRSDLGQLHDPFLMKNMDKAVNRLSDALSSGEKILVYGDYDVDGTTAVASMYLFISSLTDLASYYLPDRYTEGYGISTQGIDYAAENGFTLIIALDCGIKAVDKVEYAKTKGVDFIICDHHTPGETLPDAAALLDPKQPGCRYPFKELSGCGVGFKLIQAFILQQNLDMTMAYSLLDLVAISIGADIVSMTGENRILAHYGLQSINDDPRPGIRAMLETAVAKVPISITQVVFILAPRINAAGRIGHAKGAVQLLLAKEEEEAKELSAALEKHNRERKDLDKENTAEALAEIANLGYDPDRRSTVVYSEKWHKGVVGIVASRLIEQHYRPTIVLTGKDGIIGGSARSIDGFDLYEALDECSHLLLQFGGHMMAAGMSLKAENLEAFCEAFENACRARLPENPQPTLEIDLEVDASFVSDKNLRVMEQLAPFGPGNMHPVFVTKKLRDAGSTRPVGGDMTHLKLELADADGYRLNGIGFGLGPWAAELNEGAEVDVVYSLSFNEYRGMTTVQLMVKDIRLSEAE